MPIQALSADLMSNIFATWMGINSPLSTFLHALS